MTKREANECACTNGSTRRRAAMEDELLGGSQTESLSSEQGWQRVDPYTVHQAHLPEHVPRRSGHTFGTIRPGR